MSDPGSDLQKSGIRHQKIKDQKPEKSEVRRQKPDMKKLSSKLALDIIQGGKIKTKKKMDQVTGTD